MLESDRGLVLLDQHAAHERILFELMLERLEHNLQAPSQKLLLPETIELSPRDAQFLREQLAVLTRLGVGLSEFGERTFLLDALPPFVKVTDARRFVLDLVDELKAPLWWALVPIGLETVTAWGEQRRGWNEGQARRILAGGLILLAAGLTALIAIPRLIGSQAMPGWGDAEARYARLDQALDDLGIGPEAVILVNNPPGFYAATGRPSIAIPDGDLNTSLAAANRFQADFLVLEANHPDGLEAIYWLPNDN